MKLIISNIEIDEIQNVLKTLGINKVTWNIDNYIYADWNNKIDKGNIKEINNSSEPPINSTKSKVNNTKRIIKFKIRKCTLCGEDYQPKGARDKCCDKCKTLKNKSEISNQELKSNKSDTKIITKHCPKCHKTLNVSEFDEGAFYCKKCTLKVQSAPKIKRLLDPEVANSILALPIPDRWSMINRLPYDKRRGLLDYLDFNNPNKAEREFAYEFNNGLISIK